MREQALERKKKFLQTSSEVSHYKAHSLFSPRQCPRWSPAEQNTLPASRYYSQPPCEKLQESMLPSLAGP